MVEFLVLLLVATTIYGYNDISDERDGVVSVEWEDKDVSRHKRERSKVR